MLSGGYKYVKLGTSELKCMEQRYNDDDGEKYIRNDDNEMAVTHDTKK